MYSEEATVVAPKGAEVFAVALVFALILAILSALLVRILFMNRSRDGALSGFSDKLYRFLNFDCLVTIEVCKFMYILVAMILTMTSLVFMAAGGSAVPSFGKRAVLSLLTIVFGNLVLRLGSEAVLILFKIFERMGEIPTVENTECLTQKREEAAQGVTFCRNCGNAFDASLTACPYCGAKRE